MAHIMFVRALIALLFLTTTANAGSMKELALIALLGGGDFSCGDTYFSKARFEFIDMICQMETQERGLCHIIDDPSEPPYQTKITLEERNGVLTVLLLGDPVATCDVHSQEIILR